MIYFIKFMYSFVLPPGLFVVLLLLLALWLWRNARKQAWTLLAVTMLFYLCTTSLVGDALIRSLEGRYEQPVRPEGDSIVVLGGGATTGTPDLDGDGNLLGSAANRLLTAVRLHRETGLPILFSGGSVFADSGNEADIARRQLIGLGVSPDKIMVENRSLNTEQNARFTAELLVREGLSRPILVTSAFHLPRAMVEFNNAGMKPTPFPTDYQASASLRLYPGKFSPSPGALNQTGTALKEYVGLIAAWIR